MNISEKMLALGKKSSVIRELFEYGRRRKAEIGEENVFDFSLGNPSVPAPEKVTEVMRRLIDAENPVALHGYTSAPGDMGVRTKIAEDINRRFGIPCRPDLVYMTCGAAASLTISLSAITCEDDEVIVLAPFFPEYRVFVENAGAALRIVRGKLPDFRIDFDALEGTLNEHTKALIINSPNNPTGAVVPECDIIRLSEVLRAAEKKFGHPIYIIADEPYRPLVWNGGEVPYIPNYYDNTIVCYSFSKAVSLPGERIGYIFVSPTANEASDLFAAICGAGRSLGFVCAPSLMQLVVGECLDVTSDFSVYKTNRDLLLKNLTEMGYETVPPDGAFYLFLKSPEPDANAFAEKAKKYELLLVPGDDFGGEGYVRVSYCVTTEQIERSLPAFKKLIEEYK